MRFFHPQLLTISRRPWRGTEDVTVSGLPIPSFDFLLTWTTVDIGIVDGVIRYMPGSILRIVAVVPDVFIRFVYDALEHGKRDLVLPGQFAFHYRFL